MQRRGFSLRIIPPAKSARSIKRKPASADTIPSRMDSIYSCYRRENISISTRTELRFRNGDGEARTGETRQSGSEEDNDQLLEGGIAC
jgi:hypothetical protein